MDSQNLPSDISILEDRFKDLQSQIKSLANEIDQKNNSLEQINQDRLELLKENQSLKSNLSGFTENNSKIRHFLLKLSQNIANSGQDSDFASEIIEEIDCLVNKVGSDDIQQKYLDADIFRIVELESKLLKYENKSSSLEKKYTASEKISQSRENYINMLLEFIKNSEEKHDSLENSLKNESRIQSESIENLNAKLSEIKSQNQEYIDKLEQATNESKILNERLQESSKNFENLQKKYSDLVLNHEAEKEKFSSQIEKLRDSLEKSKGDALEKHFEQFYPNISIFNQMFDKKLSISELYSQFLEIQNKNKNLSIEKSILEERVKSLSKESNDMKNSIDQHQEEIRKWKKLEDKILKLENENKEMSASLKFYQNSAHSLHKGVKVFHDNFINLSDKIKLLVKHETNQVNEDSTGMMALKYIMELQNKFQEFNRLQSDFEKQKLDFINEKQNIIESENKIDLLNSRLSIYEAEKRQSAAQYKALENEYQMLTALTNDCISKSDLKMVELQSNIDNLHKEIASLKDKNSQFESDSKEYSEKMAIIEQERDDLQNKVKVKTQQNQYLNDRLTGQTQLVSLLEKSLKDLENQNDNLMKSKEQLETNLRLVEEKNRKLSDKLIKIDSKSSSHKFEIDLLKQKEKFLLERLDSIRKDSNKNSELDFILDSLTKAKCSIDENLIKNLEQTESEKKSFNKLLEEKEKHWLEEKSILAEKVIQLEKDLKKEIDRNSELESQLSEVSTALNVDGSAENPNNEQSLQSQFSILSKRNNEIIQELNELKHRLLDSDQKNLSLVQLKNELEQRLSVLNEEKSKIDSEFERLVSESENRIEQLENKHKKESKELQESLQSQNSLLEARNMTCEKQINYMRSIIEELRQKLDTQKNEIKQLIEIRQSHEIIKHELDILKQQNSQEKQSYNDLHNKMVDYCNRYVKSETSQIELKKEFSSKLDRIQSHYNQLQEERDILIQSNEKTNELNLGLCSTIKTLTFKLKNNQSITEEEQSSELTALNNVIAKLTSENKYLSEKYRVFDIKEKTLNCEIDTLKSTVKNLRECLEKEKENVEKTREMFQMEQNHDFSEEILLSSQLLRSQNNELTRKCDSLQSVIEQLEQDLNNQIALNSTKETVEAELKLLKSQLQTKESLEQNLREKSQFLEEKLIEIQRENSELSQKIQKQSSEISSLNKKIALNLKMVRKNTETEYKSENTKLLKEIKDMKNKIDSLQKEVTLLENTKQQLRILAKKYKSQCDELQKSEQTSSNQSSSATTDVSKELESKILELSTQNESLKNEIDKLKNEKEKIQSQTEETEKKAKSLTQQFKQKFLSLKKMITDRDREIGILKSSATQPGNSSIIPGKSGKMPVSSMIVSASSQHAFEYLFSPSNILPSSSNEDNDRLQSAQISSHTTSFDENSFESVFPNPVSDNASIGDKRRLNESHSMDHNVKRKRENPDNSSSNNLNVNKQNEMSSDNSQTGGQINEDDRDSNSIGGDNISNKEGQEHCIDQEQAESNDGNASSTDSSSRLGLIKINFAASNSSMNDVNFQPSTSKNNTTTTDNYGLTTPILSQLNPPSLITTGSNEDHSSIPTFSFQSSHADSFTLNPDHSTENILRQPETISPDMLLSHHNFVPLFDEDRIVPNIPESYSQDTQFENSSQVPQSQFVFSRNISDSDVRPTTPVFSETISSLLSVEEFEANPIQLSRSTEIQEDSNVENDPTPSSSFVPDVMPTNSNDNNNNSNQQEGQSGSLHHRPRKLKIRRS